MNRVEKFRYARRNRRRLAFVCCLLFFMFPAGILVVDYSLNALMKDEKGISLFTVRDLGGNRIEAGIMGKKLEINTYYLMRDMDRVNRLVGAILEK